MAIPVLLRDLITPLTETEATNALLDVLKSAGFSTTSWRKGGVQLTLISAVVKLYLRATEVIAVLARGAYLDTAEGPWLTLLAKSVYNEDRKPASYAEGTVLLTNTGGVPYTIEVGQLWFSDASDGTGKRYNNTTGGILAAGGTITLSVKAEAGGEDYNGLFSQIDYISTPLPGVSVGSGTIVTAAEDEESDEQLRDRCRIKWASLSPTVPAAAYEYWALSVSPITRVYVDANAPDGPNSVRVYVATSSGAAQPNNVSDVNALLQTKKAIGATVTTLSATNQVIEPDMTVYVSGVDPSAAATQINAVLEAYFKTIPIGGREYGGQRGIFTDEIIDVVRSVEGVVRVRMYSSDPLALDQIEVPVLNTNSIAVTAV